MKNLIQVILIGLALFSSSCAGSGKSLKTAQGSISPIELGCRQSCDIMAMCSSRAGAPYSDHEKVVCSMQCLNTDPKLRDAVTSCSIEVFSKNCNRQKMGICVKKKLTQ